MSTDPINPEDAWANTLVNAPEDHPQAGPFTRVTIPRTPMTVSGLIEALTAIEKQIGDRRIQISVPIADCVHVVVELAEVFAGWAIPDLGATDKASGDEQNAEVIAAGEPDGIWPDEDLAVILHGYQPCKADLDNLKRNWSTR